MKKSLLFSAAIFAASTAFAGGYLTNTNQSVAFVRNPARLATFDIDGAYSNPAGLAWIGEGWHIGFNWQNAVQERNITSTFAGFAGNVNQLGNPTRHFNGEAEAPFIPSLDFAWQKKNWTVSGHFGVIGGGGEATFAEGLPMFEAPISAIPSLLNTQGYATNMNLVGSQYIYGIQAGVTYKIFDNLGDLKQGLSVHLGARASIARNGYEGYLRDVKIGNLDPAQSLGTLQTTFGNLQKYAQQAAAAGDMATAQEYAAKAQSVGALTLMHQGIELECDQKGWGIAPIIGLDYRIGKVNIGARYEFKTRMEVENETKTIQPKEILEAKGFGDGVKTDNDIPGILAIGAQWSVLPKWRVMAGWNCYFDKSAKMAGGKEKTLNHNTHEITVGTEVDVCKWITLSAGFQNTDYGTSDAFQSDLSFSCDSYMLSVGLRANINKHVSLDAGFMQNFYKDYTKSATNYNSTGLSGKDVYSRENRVFGLGVTWHI